MAARAPLAIIGIGCRFPGADTPEQLWDLIEEPEGALVPAPRARPVVLDSGLVEGVRRFDARRCDVDPEPVDPEPVGQRHDVLLATAGDALRAAGHTEESVAGRSVGVFLGQRDDTRGDARTFRTTTAADDTVAGRISAAWGLRGPRTTVDAACSSGVLAVHLACESLRAGECDTALAGGVGADDTGVLVLTRLDRAVADGHTVHAVILGTARTSAARSTRSSAEGYLQVIGRACVNAGVLPEKIGYVEAHGSGAPAGDRVELQAIGTAIGIRRPAAEPCLVGSVTSDIGAEAAGGIAGLIKAALVLRHRRLPACARHARSTSSVDWAGLGIAPVDHTMDWPYQGAAIAGVNTRGLSGTFVHIVVGEPPRADLVGTV
jgi:acyl transferase domain-containing protein